MRTRGLQVLVALVAALTVTAAAAQVASACAVENTNSHVKYSGKLQEAVSDAEAGNTLKVSGTCEGETVIGKSLTIAGKKATLKGEGNASVVTVEKGVTVAISGVTITGGTGDKLFGNSYGGGVYSEGTFTLSKSTVTGNSAYSGGGLDNEHGTMTLVKATVSKNTAVESGAMRTTSALMIEDSKITENATPSIVGFYGAATIVIRDHSSVSGSSEESGAIVLLNAKSLTVENSKIEHNQATTEGGAIWAEGTPVTLEDAAIEDNQAHDGGGVYLTEGASLKTKGHSKLTKNTAIGGKEHGGGVFKAASAGAVEEENAREITKNTPENLYTEPAAPSFTIEKEQRIEGEPSYTKTSEYGTYGETVNYKIVVRNTGNTRQEFSPLRDANCTGISPSGTTTLPVGREEVFTCNRVLTGVRIATWTNEASIDGSESGEETSNTVELINGGRE